MVPDFKTLLQTKGYNERLGGMGCLLLFFHKIPKLVPKNTSHLCQHSANKDPIRLNMIFFHSITITRSRDSYSHFALERAYRIQHN